MVVVAHTGLDHLDSLADIWQGIPLHKTLRIRWHSVPSSEVPHDMAGLSDWLFTEWEQMDDWVAANQESDDMTGVAPEPAAPGAGVRAPEPAPAPDSPGSAGPHPGSPHDPAP